MQNRNLQGGFIPFIVIAIIAVLAIGGGTYAVIKHNEAKNAQPGDNVNTQANANADVNANVNANLGVNANINAKGSLRSLLALGKNTMCTFNSTAGGTNSSGTVFISTEGSMRGDFTSQTSAGTQASSMIVKNGTSYVWSGSQGAKMDVKSNANASSSAKTKVDLDSQVNYKCGNWSKDESKFVIPTTVKFIDLNAMLKGSTTGGVDVNALIKAKGY